MQLEIAGRAGRLEALLDEPPADRVGSDGLVAAVPADGLRAAVVFAHPHTEYGGTMHTKVVYQAAKALARIGCAVLRFNFRGAGKSAGTFANGPGEMDDAAAAVLAARLRGAALVTGHRVAAAHAVIAHIHDVFALLWRADLEFDFSHC